MLIKVLYVQKILSMQYFDAVSAMKILVQKYKDKPPTRDCYMAQMPNDMIGLIIYYRKLFVYKNRIIRHKQNIHAHKYFQT